MPKKAGMMVVAMTLMLMMDSQRLTMMMWLRLLSNCMCQIELWAVSWQQVGAGQIQGFSNSLEHAIPLRMDTAHCTTPYCTEYDFK